MEKEPNPKIPLHRQSAWRVTAISLLIVTLALIGALAYGYTLLDQSRNETRQAKNERDNLQNQILKLEQQNKTVDDTKITTPTTLFKSQKGVEVVVSSPLTNATDLSSPLTVSGKVPGNWSQEGEFKVLLKDSTGATNATATAKLSGDWMTDELRDFTATLSWEGGHSGTHHLILEKANPSGLPANDDSVDITLEF